MEKGSQSREDALQAVARRIGQQGQSLCWSHLVCAACKVASWHLPYIWFGSRDDKFDAYESLVKSLGIQEYKVWFNKISLMHVKVLLNH